MKRYDLMTPEGTRDLLFDESVARRQVEEKLHRLFEAYGYSEVITPGIEFYDVFYSKQRYFAPESMYKLSDNKGRLIVVRPDSTMPIARLVATRLKDVGSPLKLYYTQNVFRVNPKDSGRDDEITQSGIEIIGGCTKRADFEATALALEVLGTIDSSDMRFEIGSCDFYKELVSALPINDEHNEQLRQLIENKNYPELRRALAPYSTHPEAAMLLELPHLFGGEEVFAKAKLLLKIPKIECILEELESLYLSLSALYGDEVLSVDLSMVNKTNYYTGVLFKGYISGYGMPVISGGRYDTLLGDFGEHQPAIGFAVNVNAAAQEMLKKADEALLVSPDVLIHSERGQMEKAVAHAKALVQSGLKIELSLCDNVSDSKKYAQQKGIERVDLVGAEGVIINDK